jgi:exodeoxyribonuclease III
MKIATWNVNSLTARHQHVLDWLAGQPADAPVDTLCLQELKMTEDKFPLEALAAAGYPHCAVFGQKTYNGVAIVSRHPLSEVTRNIEGFADEQSRVISATVQAPGAEPLRVINGYFVNGQEPGSEQQIQDFCSTRYGVSFPLMSKVEVNGAHVLVAPHADILGLLVAAPRPLELKVLRRFA